jgi:hypothetical protein
VGGGGSFLREESGLARESRVKKDALVGKEAVRGSVLRMGPRNE